MAKINYEKRRRNFEKKKSKKLDQAIDKARMKIVAILIGKLNELNNRL